MQSKKKKLTRGLPPRKDDNEDQGVYEVPDTPSPTDPAASENKVAGVTKERPMSSIPGPSERHRVIYASWLDRHVIECNPDGSRKDALDPRGIAGVVEHQVDEDTGELHMLVRWEPGRGGPANGWVTEEALFGAAPGLVVGYWEGHPAGGRQAALRGTGLEIDVFALWYPPLLRMIKGRWHVAVEVEYCGYAGTTEVVADLLEVDIKALMTEYWRRVGGRPRLR